MWVKVKFGLELWGFVFAYGAGIEIGETEMGDFLKLCECMFAVLEQM